MQTPRNLTFIPLGLALAGAFLLAACGGKETPPGPGAGGPGAPAVTVLTVQTESVPVASELPGRTSPYQIAELRPQVTGIVKERLFKEGSEVKAGQGVDRVRPAPDPGGLRQCAGQSGACRSESVRGAAEGRALRRAGENRGGEQAGQ